MCKMHTMSTFFSSVDTAELHDNAPLNQFYLSLIVNNDGKYCAKVAYVGEVTRQFKLKNPGDSEEYSSTTEEMLILVDLDIIKEDRRTLPSETFQKRYESLKETIEAAKKTKYTAYSAGSYSRTYTPNKRFEYDWKDEPELFDNTPWEDKKSTQTQRFKGKELPKVGKTGLKISMSDTEFDKYLLNWLSEGLSAFEGLHFNVVPDSVEEALKVFDDYFDKDTPTEHLDYFIQYMTKLSVDHFKEVDPNLVQFKGTKAMDSWDGLFTICIDLHQIFDSYPEYLIELSKFKA